MGWKRSFLFFNIGLGSSSDCKGWFRLYSQTTINDYSSCTLGKCTFSYGADDFLNLDLIPDLPNYEFKIVWDGISGVQWKQTGHPLKFTNTNMNPKDAKMFPSGAAPPNFAGLSKNMAPQYSVLDANIGITWYYAIGTKAKWGANFPMDNRNGVGAKKVELFINLGPDIKTTAGESCHFPFTYDGKTYNECTKHGREKLDQKLWCSTTATYSGKWGYCPENANEKAKKSCSKQTYKKCHCWGDPHCDTFDGTRNDVYGVNTYIIAQSRPNTFPKFRVRMETETWSPPNGRVSAARKTFVDLYDDQGKPTATIIMDRFGKSEIKMHGAASTVPLFGGQTGGGLFTFTKSGKIMTATTSGPYGIIVQQNGFDVSVSLPSPFYDNDVEGICGNMDGDKTNDYQKSDGTILPYNSKPDGTGKGVPGHKRSDSEWESAKSWITPGGADGARKRRAVPDPGPKPLDVECKDPTVLATCQKMFAAPWLLQCNKLLTDEILDGFVSACNVDYCMRPTSSTKHNLIKNYVSVCNAQSPTGTLMCDWETHLSGSAPSCPANSEYKGCASVCDFDECGENPMAPKAPCTPTKNVFPACVCKTGFKLLNQQCVPVAQCNQAGWSKWSEWTDCPTGQPFEQHRFKVCLNAACAKPHEQETKTCVPDYQDPCNGPSDTSLHVGTCPGGSQWTSWQSRDEPSGLEDNEERKHDSDLTKPWCANPTAIEARVKNTDLYCTDQKVTISPQDGFRCINAQQSGTCKDYERRYCCAPSGHKQCKCWGDPHCITFDGTTNDVYGVATYVMAQSKQGVFPKFKVQMETQPHGVVSTVRKLTVDLYDDQGQPTVTIELFGNGNADVIVRPGTTSSPLTSGYNQNGFSFSIVGGSQLFVETDIGVSVSLQGYTAIVNVPEPTYSGKVEGVCGNNNGNMKDDFQKKDGTVLPYHSAYSGVSPGRGYERSMSEWESAKSWITGGTTGRRKRDIADDLAGPLPHVIQCTDQSIIDECENMLQVEWLKVCTDLVDATVLKDIVEACKIDYCMWKTEKTKKDVFNHYVKACQAKSDTEILCDWETKFDGNTPKCGANETYEGCANQCMLKSCQNGDAPCTQKGNTFSGCVCADGYAVLNGECILVAECAKQGWSKWGKWSECSLDDESTRRRVRSCLGATCDKQSDAITEKCPNPPDRPSAVPESVQIKPLTCLSDCWKFDEKLGSCVPKTDSECYKLTCLYNEIHLDFDSKLFGLKDNAATPFVGQANVMPKWDAGRWRMDCKLGDCGMQVGTKEVDGKTEISFMFDVKINRQFDAKIEGVEIFMVKEKSVEVNFECRYAQDIKVATELFDVNAYDAKDSAISYGHLDKGFTLALFTDSELTKSVNDETNYIGSLVWAHVQWSVKNLTDKLSFYIDQVDIIVNEKSLSIVKENCYAQIFEAKPVSEKVQSTDAVMQFRSFIVGNDARKMTFKVVAAIKVCAVEGDKCKVNLSTTKENCDNTVSGYNYLP